MENEVVFYQFWRSSSSWRVRWALAIKGIAHRVEVVDLRAGDQRLASHRARNPLGYVPALFIDGHDLAESVAIMEYLEERNPTPPLYPADPWQKARVRQVVELVNSGVQPMQNLEVLHYVSSTPEAQNRWAAHWNERGMKALEALLGLIASEGNGGRYAVGDTLTAADLCLVPQVDSARRFGVDVAPFVRVLAAEQAALATEHAMAAHPKSQPGAPK